MDHFSIFLTISQHFSHSDGDRPTFTHLVEMTDADKVMKVQRFRSNVADIRMRIQVNPEIWYQEIRIRLSDHFWLTFRPWPLTSTFYVCAARVHDMSYAADEVLWHTRFA